MDIPAKNRSKSGLMTVVAIFLFGGVFVAGLYVNSRRNLPPEYRAATAGVPPQTLSIISCNLGWSAAPAELIGEFKMLNADFVLLQQVSHKDAEAMAIALDMRHGGKLQLYYSPTNPNSRDVPGNAILSRHPIYQGRAIADRGATDAGIWVEPVIAGRRFLLGNLDLTDPPLAAPALKLRQQAIDELVISWKAVPRPFIIGGVIPHARSGGFATQDEASAQFIVRGPWSIITTTGAAAGVQFARLSATP